MTSNLYVVRVLGDTRNDCSASILAACTRSAEELHDITLVLASVRRTIEFPVRHRLVSCHCVRHLGGPRGAYGDFVPAAARCKT